MADMIKRLCAAQYKRVVATILGTVERDMLATNKITSAEYEAYRKVVLGAIGSWHDFMLDVVKVSDEDTIRNDSALELLERVHASQRSLSQHLLAQAPVPVLADDGLGE